jgi:predicted nucleotidyltransferase
MRLSLDERATILRVVGGLTDGRARVWLFGSRTRDDALGGDLDLMVESVEPVEHPAQLMAAIGARLEQDLGERRIDLLLLAPNLRQLPVHRAARATGILLS